MSRAERVIAFAESLPVTSGMLAGQNFQLGEFQRAWIRRSMTHATSRGAEFIRQALLISPRQGKGKSSGLAKLVPDLAWFAEDISSLGTKDAAQDLRGKWLIELSELSAMSKREVETVKSFLSKRIDTYRPSYGRDPGDYPRQCGFAGTTNNEEPLKDDTGNRRFWTVIVGKADGAALVRDRDQLWAEATYRYHAGEPWWLDDELEEQARVEQAARVPDDPWLPLIEDFVDGVADGTTRNETHAAELLRDACKVEPSQWHDGNKKRVINCIKQLGWVKGGDGVIRGEWEKVKTWIRPPRSDGLPGSKTGTGEATGEAKNAAKSDGKVPTSPVPRLKSDFEDMGCDKHYIIIPSD